MRFILKYMEISRNDPFDHNLCVRGLRLLITYMHSDLYEFAYYLTFKKSLKSYSKEFNDPWVNSIDHDEFFKKIEDSFVQNCIDAQNELIYCKLAMNLRFGIEEIEENEDELIISQAGRFRPYFLVHKRSKSYKKLIHYYERTLVGFIKSLYTYACALTAQSYKIPLVLKKQFDLNEEESLKLLNQEDNTVALLIDLIKDLRRDLRNLREMIK